MNTGNCKALGSTKGNGFTIKSKKNKIERFRRLRAILDKGNWEYSSFVMVIGEYDVAWMHGYLYTTKGATGGMDIDLKHSICMDILSIYSKL